MRIYSKCLLVELEFKFNYLHLASMNKISSTIVMTTRQAARQLLQVKLEAQLFLLAGIPATGSPSSVCKRPKD